MQLREHQRANRCPSIPESEWYQPGRQDLGHIAIAREGEDLALEAHHCPGAHARTAAALEAQRALKWWEQGQLELLYPAGVPAPVTEAVDVASAAKDEWLAEGIRLRRATKGGGS